MNDANLQSYQLRNKRNSIVGMIVGGGVFITILLVGFGIWFSLGAYCSDYYNSNYRNYEFFHDCLGSTLASGQKMLNTAPFIAVATIIFGVVAYSVLNGRYQEVRRNEEPQHQTAIKNVNAPPSSQPAPADPKVVSAIDTMESELKRLAKLKQEGLLDEDEYTQLKRQLISKG